MIFQLPLLIILLVFDSPLCLALSRLQLGPQTGPLEPGSPKPISRQLSSRSIPIKKRSNLNTNPDGSTFLWLPQDEYSGKTFFEYALYIKLNGNGIKFFLQSLDFLHRQGPYEVSD